jgi:hypothetical protein
MPLEEYDEEPGLEIRVPKLMATSALCWRGDFSEAKHLFSTTTLLEPKK